MAAGHAGPAVAYAAAAAASSPVTGLDGYQRLQAAGLAAQATPVVVAAAPPADLQQSLTQNKDLLHSASSPAVNDTILSVRDAGYLCRC